jgi:hypothetical protein
MAVDGRTDLIARAAVGLRTQYVLLQYLLAVHSIHTCACIIPTVMTTTIERMIILMVFFFFFKFSITLSLSLSLPTYTSIHILLRAESVSGRYFRRPVGREKNKKIIPKQFRRARASTVYALTHAVLSQRFLPPAVGFRSFRFRSVPPPPKKNVYGSLPPPSTTRARAHTHSRLRLCAFARIHMCVCVCVCVITTRTWVCTYVFDVYLRVRVRV